MPRFLTIGYGDQAGYDRTDQAVRDAAHAHDSHLSEQGMQAGMAGSPLQVRNHDGEGIQTQTGPFMHASLPVAGFALLEAASIEEAVEMVSLTPCAVAQGVVEIWPLN